MLLPTAKLTRRTASRRMRWRTTWEKRRTTRTVRVMRRMMKMMTLMDQQGREQLRMMMMMMKRTKLKPRSRRQISRVWPSPRCLDDDATKRTDSQFSSKPSTPQSSLLNKNTFTNRISLYFYLHFIFL